jgi:hypothetical protein
MGEVADARTVDDGVGSGDVADELVNVGLAVLQQGVQGRVGHVNGILTGSDAAREAEERSDALLCRDGAAGAHGGGLWSPLVVHGLGLGIRVDADAAEVVPDVALVAEHHGSAFFVGDAAETRA